jgi:hypothetical protein
MNINDRTREPLAEAHCPFIIGTLQNFR